MKNQKGFVNLVLIGALIILIGAASYFAWSKKSNNVNNEPLSPATSEVDTSNWKTYTNTQYGVEIKYPQSWYAYDGQSANTDVLSSRYFVPDYDAKKSMEQQGLFSVTVFNKNPNSEFDAPKRYITKTRTDEKWDQVTINSYVGTKITNTATNKATEYVFEHNGKIYVFGASEASLFDKILPTFKFIK